MADGTGADVARFEALTEVVGKAQQMMLEFWTGDGAKLLATPPAPDAVPQLAAIWADWAKAWTAADPTKLVRLGGDWWVDSLKLWSGLLTGEPATMPAPTEKDDKRFRDPIWSEAPVFDLVRRSYLLASHYLTESVGVFEGLEPDEREQLRFQARQFIDAMSPTNFAALNPEVMAEAQATNGESLLAGLSNMLDDLRRGKLTMTDETAFEVGRNVAATPGEVVFENRLFQLIHYRPTTETVAEIPLLVLPPWINKFYILDLTPEKSFIRWAVDQGLSVFVVSWAQGSPALADVDFDDYVLEGQLTAVDTVRAITRAPATHAIGYCVAGTTLAATLAYMAATGEAGKVRTATFFTAQTDFTESGDLLNMVNEPMLDAIDRMTREQGYLDGRFLATTFNLLRPTDLMWNYVVNNYLKGKEYTPFDLLYWNSDPTHVPGAFTRSYLRGFYRENRLATPGAVQVAGVPIDLRRVRTPVYIQAGRDDHIAPAVSSFKLTRAFGGPARFVLAGSGHIAGVVNPPAAQKYQHWILPEGAETPDTLEGFRAAAIETRGSWWPDWIRWLKPQSGGEVPARVPGEAPGFPAIEPAPGRYVKERIA
jgi:polyhydroxyalkanoate synthase